MAQDDTVQFRHEEVIMITARLRVQDIDTRLVRTCYIDWSRPNGEPDFSKQPVGVPEWLDHPQ